MPAVLEKQNIAESNILFANVPKMIHGGNYRVNVGFGQLKSWMADNNGVQGIDLDPDFQRGHVWVDEQRIKYVESLIRGGQSSRTLYWNHPSYMSGKTKECDLADKLVLVDGKQRLTSCLMFLDDQIPVFGHYLSEYKDEVDRRKVLGMSGVNFEMCVNNLQTRKDMLTWYLDLNDGGVVHSSEEIERVKRLLDEEALKL